MTQPTWYFISIVETNLSLENLTSKFQTLCCLQPGAKNYGWRLVTTKPKRYLFQLISTKKIPAVTLYNLSMMIQEVGKVVGEATNCVLADQPNYSYIFVVDSGFRIIGRNNVLDTFENKLNPNTSVHYIDGFMTINATCESIPEAVRTKYRIEELLHAGNMTLIATFYNWKK